MNDAEKPAITMAEAGHLGGTKTKATHDPDYFKRLGARGGKAVAQKYGPGHMKAIGTAGGAATKAAGTDYDALAKKGRAKLAQIIAAGKAAMGEHE